MASKVIVGAMWASLGWARAPSEEATPQPTPSQQLLPTDPLGYAITASATPLDHLQIAAGAGVSHDAGAPGVAIDQGTAVGALLGLGLGERLSLSATAPVVLGPGGPVAGDLRLGPKLSLLRLTDRRPIGLALSASGEIPIGPPAGPASREDAALSAAMALEVADRSVRGGEYRIRGAVNVGTRLLPLGTLSEDGLSYRAALSARPARALEIGGDLAGAIACGSSGLAPFALLPWLRLHAGRAVALTVGGGLGLAEPEAPDPRLFGGLVLLPELDPSARDRDGDQLPDRSDLCVEIAEDPDGFEDDDGCLDEDDDQDGIIDRRDSCPRQAEDPDGFEDHDGCPDPDDDGDRIPDRVDRCPTAPEDPDGFRDLDGCPDPDDDGDGIADPSDPCPRAAGSCDDDQDRDGIRDRDDACPSEAEDIDDFRDHDGCPDPDDDGDRIPDLADLCPLEPEDHNGRSDEDGCVDPPLRASVRGDRIVVLGKVPFAYGRASIQEAGYPLLEEVAAVIREHPEIGRIQVEGHTDADGRTSSNRALSQARAEAVVAWLIRAGVDPDRLVAKGFGESLPIDSNDTAPGKAKNRRVEFTILEQD